MFFVIASGKKPSQLQNKAVLTDRSPGIARSTGIVVCSFIDGQSPERKASIHVLGVILGPMSFS